MRELEKELVCIYEMLKYVKNDKDDNSKKLRAQLIKRKFKIMNTLHAMRAQCSLIYTNFYGGAL